MNERLSSKDMGVYVKPPEFLPLEEDDWQSKEHEGPCCGSCDWEWAYTDIGMRNFGFGCCCKTTIYNKD